jgi:hypothetical protein
MPSNSISVRTVLVRYFSQNYFLRMELFLYLSPPNLYAFLFFPVGITFPTHPLVQNGFDLSMCFGVYNSWNSSLCVFFTFCYFLPLIGWCFLPVQPIMLYVYQVKPQVHWSFKIKLTTNSEVIQIFVVKFIPSCVNFVHCYVVKHVMTSTA